MRCILALTQVARTWMIEALLCVTTFDSIQPILMSTVLKLASFQQNFH